MLRLYRITVLLPRRPQESKILPRENDERGAGTSAERDEKARDNKIGEQGEEHEEEFNELYGVQEHE